MKSGLDTLQGISNSTLTIVETLLTNSVPQRITGKSGVRNKLKKTFKGSYGQNFTLEIEDQELLKEYRKIGKHAITEIISYFINEALYLEPENLSPKAKQAIDKLGDNAEKLTKQLRKSSLADAHEVPIKSEHKVKLRFKKNNNETVTLAEITYDTSKSLEAKIAQEDFLISASIRRFNTNTGNGRLQIEDTEHTVAFGFSELYKNVASTTKKTLSQNLHQNNGRPVENWTYLSIRVSPIRRQDGQIVKYIVRGILDD